MAQTQVAQHRLAAQIEVTIAQPELLADRLVVMERRRLRLREHRELGGKNFDFAARKVRVDGARRPLADATLHLEHELGAQALCLGEYLGAVGIEHDLKQPFAIAKVDEDHAAMIAAPVHPTGNGDFAANRSAVYLAAVVTAHERWARPKRSAMLR